MHSECIEVQEGSFAQGGRWVSECCKESWHHAVLGKSRCLIYICWIHQGWAGEKTESEGNRKGEWGERSLGRRTFGASDVWKVVAHAIKQSRKISELDGCWGAAVKPSQRPRFLGPRGWRVFTVSASPATRRSSCRCCPSLWLKWFLKRLLLQRKRERKCICVCPYKKVIKTWWSALWLMMCWILMTGTWWVFGSHTICLHYYYSCARVIYSSGLWEHKLGFQS